jgi:hypothetical protein
MSEELLFIERKDETLIVQLPSRLRFLRRLLLIREHRLSRPPSGTAVPTQIPAWKPFEGR